MKSLAKNRSEDFLSIGKHIAVNLTTVCREGCHLVIWSFTCFNPSQIKRLVWQVNANQDRLVSGNKDLMEEKIMAFLSYAAEVITGAFSYLQQFTNQHGTGQMISINRFLLFMKSIFLLAFQVTLKIIIIL